MAVEELAKVGFTKPTVDPGADFDAEDFRHDDRPAEPPCEIDLTEPAFAEQAVDRVAELRFRTDDHLFRREQWRAAADGHVRKCRRSGGQVRCSPQGWQSVRHGSRKRSNSIA